MRTMGGSAPGFGGKMSPITRAIADSTRWVGAGFASLHDSGLATMPSNPRIRNWPQRVGKSASASLRTDSKGIFRLYGLGSTHLGCSRRATDVALAGLIDECTRMWVLEAGLSLE